MFHTCLNILLFLKLVQIFLNLLIINPPLFFILFINNLTSNISDLITSYRYTPIDNTLHQRGRRPNAFNNINIISNLFCYIKYTNNKIKKEIALYEDVDR